MTDQERTISEQMDVKRGYATAIFDVLQIMNDMMSPENHKVLNELNSRMQHQENIRAETGFDLTKD